MNAPPGSVLLPEVNSVDVAVMFHPAPEPVASAMSSGCVAWRFLFWPFSVADGNVTLPGVLANPSDPAVKVAEAVVAPAGAAINSRLPIAATATPSFLPSFMRSLSLVKGDPTYARQVHRGSPVVDRAGT